MANALVFYGSTTGNTESTAHLIAKTIAENNIVSTVKDVTAVDQGDFNGNFDLIVMGSSTWGDDEIELQEDFAEFFENMDGLNLKGKKVAVFGCGDSTYEHFCGAVDAIEGKLRDMGADLVTSGLKIDGDPDDAEGDIVDWASGVASSI